MSERALAWTLLHFLWQGAVLGLLAAAVLHFLRRPQLRYAAACFFLLAMAAAPLATYLTLTADRLILDIHLAASPAALAAVAAIASARPVWIQWLAQFWTTGSALVLLRSVGAWALAWSRTRRGQTELIDARGRVRIYRSFTAAAPYAFGALRPVILIPAAALLRLTPRQLEAVIEHELAHIRRHDYAVNILQTLVEGLLFYHPAVWWLSARIRHERELCCDEAAVAHCGDRVVYSEALLTLEQTRLEFALAATGGRLTERIGRLLGMEQKTLSPAAILGGAAVVAICCGLIWAHQDSPPPPPPAPRPELPPPPAPRAPAAAKAPAPPSDTVVIDGKIYRRKNAVPPAPPAAPQAPKAALAPPAPPAPALSANERMDELQRRLEALDHQQEALMQHRKMLEREMEMQQRQFTEQEKLAQRQLTEAELKQRQLEQKMRLEDQHARQLAERQDYEKAKAALELAMQQQKIQHAAEEHEVQAKLAQMNDRQAAEKELQRRIVYSDERFKEDGRRGSETDRGKTYLKFGPPDEIESHPDAKEAWRYRSGQIFRFEAGKLVSKEADI
ncbi:MAG: GWxTD domain-containing protein [Acidobacteria bacterium]|nr:GWxTD domain-containing protein [Acidobacteriota bacterium]